MKNECTGNKKLLPFYILRILQDYSEADNPLTQETIINYLDKNYNLTIERKAISRNIEWLTDLGYDIGNIHGKGYYLVARDFEDSELRLLIDSVRFSKFIKKSHSDEIITKLLNLGTPKFRKYMSAVKFLPSNLYVNNADLFLHIEQFAEAISHNKKVAFQYLEYNASKELTPVWNEKIIVSPKELVATNGYYYLIGLIEGNDIYSNFRLDKIKAVKVLPDNIEINLKFNLKEYLSTHPLMYCGEPTSATLRINPIIMNDVIDFFGTNYTIQTNVIEGNDLTDYLEIVVRANEPDIRDFALRNAHFVEVLSPDNIRQKLKRTANNLTNKYN